jgi:hypothetical protein
MKSLKILKKTCALTMCFFLLISCSKDENVITPIEENAVAPQERVNNDGWNVQVMGKTIGFNDNKSFPKRYKNLDGGLFMKVVSSDPKTSSGSGGARTELRSTTDEFNSGSGHRMVVKMKLVKSSDRVVVGQLFSRGIGSDLAQVVMFGRKLVARDGAGKNKTLSNNVGTGVFGFDINTSGGKTTITHNKQVFETKLKGSGCYFKTGVYLLAGGSAEVSITSISKN